MDWSVLKDVGLFVAGLIIGPLAYFAKRRVERRSDHEDLELKERLLKINKEMKEQDLTPDQLKELEQLLRRKLKGRSSAQEAEGVVVTMLEGLSERTITQAEMNQVSHQDVENADLELRHAYERLAAEMSPDDLKRLQETQTAWREFRDKQVEFAGGFYEGGSIRPLIHNVEAHALTEARTRELRRQYEELRSR